MKRGESLQREEVRLDPDDAATAILVAMHQRVPVVLWSHPGVGKTALVCQIGERLGRLVATLVGSTLEATDIGGYPVLGEQGVEFRPPAQLARIAGTDAILFLDELTKPPPRLRRQRC
jgi:MoxR-like ATPase